MPYLKSKIQLTIFLVNAMSFSFAYSDNFDPHVYKKEIFGKEIIENIDSTLEPYWAQWRVGSHLAKFILTAAEKDTPIKIALFDAPTDIHNPAFHNMNIHSGAIGPESNELIQDSRFGYHGTYSASIFCSNDPCSVGITTNVDFCVRHMAHEESIVDALNYALDNNIKIVNLSIGYFSSPLTEEMISLLERIEKSNMIIVWASGNEGEFETFDPQDYQNLRLFPYDLENIFVVTSVDPSLNFSSFSNADRTVSFAAPSHRGKITSIHAFDDQYFGGTSGAAPVISGILLNMLKVNPSLTPKEVKHILKLTSFDLSIEGYDIATGWGMPNMVKALYAARFIKMGFFPLSFNLNEDKSNFLKLLRERIELSRLTYDQVVQSSKTLDDYLEGVRNLFLDYFLTEDSTQLVKFYKDHNIKVSESLYAHQHKLNNSDYWVKNLREKDWDKLFNALMHLKHDVVSKERVLPTPVITELIEILKRKDLNPEKKMRIVKWIRSTTINILRVIAALQAVPVLTSILMDDDDDDIKETAIDALGFIGTTECVDALILILDQNESKTIKDRAKQYLQDLQYKYMDKEISKKINAAIIK